MKVFACCRANNVVGTTNTAFRDANKSCFATPAFWNGNLYIVGNHDALKVFTLDPSTGLLSSSSVAQGPYTYNWPGSQPVISARGTTNGIVWTLDQGSGTLTANDAGNITHQLFQTTVSGGINRFTAPTVVNGFVYVGGQFKLVAYSLQ